MPAFDHSLARDPPEVDRAEGHRPTRGRDRKIGRGRGAADRRPDGHPVAFGDEVLDGDAQIGHEQMEAAEDLLDGAPPAHLARVERVLDDVLGEDRVQKVDLARLGRAVDRAHQILEPIDGARHGVQADGCAAAKGRASNTTRTLLILPSSTWLHSATKAGGATTVCRSYQVTTSGPSTKVLWTARSVFICDSP